MLICFLEAVKSNGKLIPHVVKMWVEQYEKDPKPAMVELLTMLFEVIMHLVFFPISSIASFLCSFCVLVVRRNSTLNFTGSCTQLIKLAIVQACGANYRIQEEFLEETNVDDVVVALVNLAAQVSFCCWLLVYLY